MRGLYYEACKGMLYTVFHHEILSRVCLFQCIFDNAHFEGVLFLSVEAEVSRTWVVYDVLMDVECGTPGWERCAYALTQPIPHTNNGTSKAAITDAVPWVTHTASPKSLAIHLSLMMWFNTHDFSLSHSSLFSLSHSFSSPFLFLSNSLSFYFSLSFRLFWFSIYITLLLLHIHIFHKKFVSNTFYFLLLFDPGSFVFCLFLYICMWITATISLFCISNWFSWSKFQIWSRSWQRDNNCHTKDALNWFPYSLYA